MVVNLSPVGGAAAQFFDNSGNVLTGGKLYTYLAGTTTPAVTYTTNSGATAHSNPIVLNAAGRVPDSGEIWLSDSISYKFVLKDQNDVLIATYDNLIGINSNFVNFTGEEETQTATQGQTVFTLTTIQYLPATNNLLVFVNGSKQVLGDNYTETSSTSVTFVDGLNVGDIVDFCTATPINTNATTASSVLYNEGGTGAVNRTVEAKLQEWLSVKDFGATGDGVTDDTDAFNAAATEANGATILVPAGEYNITTNTSPTANWFLESGAVIIGLDNVPASNQVMQDTSRLTGNVVELNASVSPGEQIVRIGSSNPWLTKDWKEVSEFPSKFTASSEEGTPAAYLSTLVSASDPVGIGYALGITTVNNDSTASNPNGGWGSYYESIRGAPVAGDECGNLLGSEMDFINLGNTVELSPVNAFDDGITVDLWLTCGGGAAEYYGGDGNDISAAIGINPNGNSFGRGFVFRTDSVKTIENFSSVIQEALATPLSYGWSWYYSDDTICSYIDHTRHSRQMNINSTSDAVLDESYRQRSDATPTTANTNVYIHNFLSTPDGLPANYGVVGSYSVIQQTNYSSGSARFSQIWTALNSGGGFTGVGLNVGTNATFSAVNDGVQSLGNASNRWSQVYAASGTINTSDERDKQDIKDLTEAERQVAVAIKGLIKSFRFKDAVAEKGDKARIHVGVMAQQVAEAFRIVGLNPNDYALFCYDEWDATEANVDSEGNKISPAKEAGNRYGIRYDELLAFVISAL